MNKALIKTILSAAKKLFVVSLIIYLVLFLLEVVFPGFVSNSFNLNWVLGAVLVLGVLAALAPDEEIKEETVGKPSKTDYLLFAGLGIIGGLLMFYRSDLNLVPRILFSVFVAGFITAISLYLLTAKDEEHSEEAEEAADIPPTRPVWPQIRRFMARPIKLPLGVVVIGLLLLGLGFVKPKKQLPEAPAVTADQPVQPAEEQKPLSLLLKEIPISVLNGSTQVGSASAMAQFLTVKDFTISRVADADNSNYQNALIRFSPEEARVAEYLADTVGEIYPIVERAPAATDSGEIILILGNL